MTESEHQEIVDFTNNLPTLRQQVSDRELLDRCQTYLNELLDLSKDVPLQPDPAPMEQPAA
jgi:hypothetical protein